MNRLVALLFAILALALGAIAGTLGGRAAVLALAALLPLPLILKDFRIGVLALTLLLPVSSMLPPIQGLNFLNILTAASLASFALEMARGDRELVRLPAPLLWCFLLPTALGLLMALPHLPEIERNYRGVPELQQVHGAASYAVQRYVKPIAYYFAYAFLLANAVRSSERPERFVHLLAASVVLPSLAVLYTVARYPGSLADLAADRNFMAVRGGMHANEFGLLLALASGPLLFSLGSAPGRACRIAWTGAFGLASVALLFTFSRGALLAYLVVVAGFLLHHRRIKTVLASTLVAVAALAAAPDAMQERFSTGLRPGAVSDTGTLARDDLTAGRVHGWTLLAPEVLESPLVGSGLGSTQWSAAVSAGLYLADHPHNIYLELLMDLGVLGFGAVAWLFVLYARGYGALSRDDGLSPGLRSFFLGSQYALFGLLVMAATTAYYMPNSAQTYLWFSLGLLFAHWQRLGVRGRHRSDVARRQGGRDGVSGRGGHTAATPAWRAPRRAG